MKTKNVNLLITVFFLLAGCAQPKVADNNNTLVDSLNTAACSAWGSGDIVKLADIYADNAVVLTGQISMGGKDSITNVWKRSVQYAKNFKMYNFYSSVKEDMIFTEGLYTFDWIRDSLTFFEKGSYIVVWEKQSDNSWKITYHQENHGEVAN